MSVRAHHVEYTYEEYVALEQVSNVKHEYLDGQIYAMAGGSPEHAALAATVVGLLFGQLRGGKCRVHDSDLRVRVEATGLATYPDVTIVCGPRQRSVQDAFAVTNPTLIVEVLSPSNELYDRGEKFDHYRQIPSLQQYVLVAQDERRVEVRTRRDDGWAVTVVRGEGDVELASIAATFEVGALYDAAAEPPA